MEIRTNSIYRIIIVQLYFCIFLALTSWSAFGSTPVALPVSFTITISDQGVGQNTAIQINCDWQGASIYYLSQVGLSSGTYSIGVMNDGSVVSLDGKLIFSTYSGSDSNIFSINILNNVNGEKEYQYYNYSNGTITPYNNQTQWQGVGSSYIDDNADKFPSGNSISMPVHNASLSSGGIPMPAFFKISIPDSQITGFTMVKIVDAFAGRQYNSSVLSKGGEFLIKIFGNNASSDIGKGFVRSMDSKLGFSRENIPVGDYMEISVVAPAGDPDGAAYLLYKYDKSINTIKQISSNMTGNIQITPVTLSSFGDTPHFSLPAEFKLHLESVTPNTYLHIAQYWRHLYYKTQTGLSKGDYYFRLNKDNSLQSLDGKTLLNTVYSPEPPDSVMAVVAVDVDPDGWSVTGADPGKRGNDIIGFKYYASDSSYQTLSSPGETSVDLGLGWVTSDISQVYGLVQTTTEPRDVLTKGNYFIKTDEPVPGLKLPLQIRIHISGCQSDNKIMVANYWSKRGFLSQPVKDGDYWIVIYPDGLVESLDRKLTFSESVEQYIPDKAVIRLTDTSKGTQWAAFKYDRNSLSMDVDNSDLSGADTIMPVDGIMGGLMPGLFMAHVAKGSKVQIINGYLKKSFVSSVFPDPRDYYFYMLADGTPKSLNTGISFSEQDDSTIAADEFAIRILGAGDGYDFVRYGIVKAPNELYAGNNMLYYGLFGKKKGHMSNTYGLETKFFTDRNQLLFVPDSRMGLPAQIFVHMGTSVKNQELQILPYFKGVYYSVPNIAQGDYIFNLDSDGSLDTLTPGIAPVAKSVSVLNAFNIVFNLPSQPAEVIQYYKGGWQQDIWGNWDPSDIGNPLNYTGHGELDLVSTITYNNEGQIVNNQVAAGILGSGNWAGVYSANVLNTSVLSQSSSGIVRLSVNSPEITINQTHKLFISAGGWDGVSAFEVTLDVVMPDGTKFQVLDYPSIVMPNIPDNKFMLISVPISDDFPKGTYTWQVQISSNGVDKAIIAEDKVKFDIY